MLESILNKVAGLKRSGTLWKEIPHRCFPGKFAKFFRTPFSTEYKTSLIRSCEDILNSFLQMNRCLQIS